MGPGAYEREVAAVDFVDEEPVGLNVAIAVMLPVAAQRMVFLAGRKRVAHGRSRIAPRSFDMSLPRLTASLTSGLNWETWRISGTSDG